MRVSVGSELSTRPRPHAGGGQGSLHPQAQKASVAHGPESPTEGWRPAKRRAPLRLAGVRLGRGGRPRAGGPAVASAPPWGRALPPIVAHLGSQEPGGRSE